MKANKTHISLETAKLLKDCGVESEYYWQESLIMSSLISDLRKGIGWTGNWYLKEAKYASIEDEDKIYEGHLYPAYTWGEILWENAEKFFGGDRKEIVFNGKNYSVLVEDVEPYKSKEPIGYPYDNKYNPTTKILKLLQQKKYKEADLYFREHTILKKIT